MMTPDVHCPTDHQMVEIRSRLGLRLCFHPHVTRLSVAAGPQVVLLAGFRKSGVRVTLLVAAMTAGMPCLWNTCLGISGQAASMSMDPLSLQIGAEHSIKWREHVWLLLLWSQLSKAAEGTVPQFSLVFRGVLEAFHPFYSSQHTKC